MSVSNGDNSGKNWLEENLEGGVIGELHRWFDENVSDPDSRAALKDAVSSSNADLVGDFACIVGGIALKLTEALGEGAGVALPKTFTLFWGAGKLNLCILD
jgi:hypothetical protein